MKPNRDVKGFTVAIRCPAGHGMYASIEHIKALLEQPDSLWCTKCRDIAEGAAKRIDDEFKRLI